MNTRKFLNVLLTACLLLSTPGLDTNADELRLKWNLPPGSKDFLATDNAQRGAAYNPASDNVLVVSRTGETTVYVLSGADGSELYTLDNDPSIIKGGTFTLNLVGVADDGAVYAGNLSTSAANPNYKLYRWEDDSFNAFPIVAFGDDEGGDPGLSIPDADNAQRWGDSMDVRGSGRDTQILLASRSGTQASILTTTDGETFTPNAILIEGIPAGGIGLGVAFGKGNTFYGSTVNGPVYLIEYDLITGTGSVIGTYPNTIVSGGTAPLGSDPGSDYLAGLNVGTHQVTLFNISDAPNAPVFQAADSMPVSNANANGTGAVDVANQVLISLDTNNGLSVWEIVASDERLAPEIVTPPFSQSILETASVTFSVAVTGTPPFNYQWFKDGQAIAGANQSTLEFSKAAPKDAGFYHVEISNETGTATSDEVEFVVNPLIDSSKVKELWSLEPGSRSYLTTDNTQRGMTFNPATGNIIIASRSGGNHMVVLNGETGEELHEMDTDSSILVQGLFKLNMIASSDDGAVFAGNLTLNGSDTNTPYALYIWTNDSADAVPEIAFEGDPGDGIAERWGDSIDARGSGNERQVMIGSRSGSKAVVFTTQDGILFEPHLLEGTQGGIGLAFGKGDTFWTKAPGGSLNHYSFDLSSNTATLLHQYQAPGELPAAMVPIGFSPETGLLAGIEIATPDNLKIYDLSNPDQAPALIIEKLFPTDNANGNNVGAVSFGPNRLFALNTNNGLLAFELNLNAVDAQPAKLTQITLMPNTGITIQYEGTPNTEYVLEASSDFLSWTTVQTFNTNETGNGIVAENDARTQHDTRFYRIILP